MNRADVIRLAKEAGLEQLVDGMDCSDWKVEIDRFAALVAAAERGRCIKECELFAKFYHMQALGGDTSGGSDNKEIAAIEIAEAICALGDE